MVLLGLIAALVIFLVMRRKRQSKMAPSASYSPTYNNGYQGNNTNVLPQTTYSPGPQSPAMSEQKFYVSLGTDGSQFIIHIDAIIRRTQLIFIRPPLSPLIRSRLLCTECRSLMRICTIQAFQKYSDFGFLLSGYTVSTLNSIRNDNFNLRIRTTGPIL